MAATPEIDVVVIGAGAAGLAASVELEKGGLRVLCLEARDRIGGRVFTERDPLMGMPVELGAEFIHGKPLELMEIVESANLLIVDTTFSPRRKQGAQWEPEGEDDAGMWDVLDQAKTLEEPDLSWAEFLPYIDGSKEAKQRATQYVEGFNAARAGVISVHSIAQDLRAAEAIGDHQQFRVLSGYDRVPAALASQLRNPRETIQLRRTVDSVFWEKHRVSIGIAGEAGRLTARAVVITLPVSLLQHSTIRMLPAAKEQMIAAREILMGQVFRVSFHFSRRVWEDVEGLADAGFLFSNEKLFPTWWTSLPVRNNMITGWSAGPHADQLAGRAAEDIARDALQSLAKIIGIEQATLNQQVCGWHFHDWYADPLARGAYSYAKAGHLDARERLAAPLEDTLFFAGEATEFEGHSGTVHGAIASGRRAARQVLEALR